MYPITRLIGFTALYSTLALPRPALAQSPEEQAGAEDKEPPNLGDGAPKPSDGTELRREEAEPVTTEDSEDYEGTATVEAPPREVTRRTLETEDIRRLPGTRGDVLRSIEVMPGVARTSLSQGDPLLRGAAFNESQTLLNGTPVPFLYHFGGLTSFLSSKMVSKLDLYPSNFSARYGRVGGGVIDVRARDPESPKLRLALDLNLVDCSAFFETPLGKDTNVAGAVRRSNIDFVFKNFVPDDAYQVVAAPVYYDYQLFAVHRLSEATRVRLLGYGSRDTLELLFSDPNDEDPALSGAIAGEIAFHRVALELEHRPAQGLSAFVSGTFGKLDITQRFGAFRQVIDGYEVNGRAELSANLGPVVALNVGGEFAGLFASGEFYGPQPGAFEGDPRSADSVLGRATVAAQEDSIGYKRPAGYVELGVQPLPGLRLVPGVRVDYLHEFRAVTVDPRFSARYELGEHTALKGGVGYFSQAPAFWQAIPSVGNPKLDPYRVLQSSGGIEQRFDFGLKLGAEGFYKHIYDYIVSTPAREAPHFVNTGSGRIYGSELSAELHTGQTLVYVAYTLSRSERRSTDVERYRLFDNDQTHVLALTGSQGLGKGWEIGARFRLVSGNPTTPVVGAVYDARTGIYSAEYGGVNSARNPMFHQLDLRVEKTWKVGPASIAAYLDLQNAYNAKNAEGFRYSYDYSKRESVSGMPLFPNIGLRGEL